MLAAAWEVMYHKVMRQKEERKKMMDSPALAQGLSTAKFQMLRHLCTGHFPSRAHECPPADDRKAVLITPSFWLCFRFRRRNYPALFVKYARLMQQSSGVGEKGVSLKSCPPNSMSRATAAIRVGFKRGAVWNYKLDGGLRNT